MIKINYLEPTNEELTRMIAENKIPTTFLKWVLQRDSLPKFYSTRDRIILSYAIKLAQLGLHPVSICTHFRVNIINDDQRVDVQRGPIQEACPRNPCNNDSEVRVDAREGASEARENDTQGKGTVQG